MPAAQNIFPSVLLGDGYGTGREVVEFVSQAGPLGGHIGRRYHGQRLVGAAVWVTSRSTVLVTMAVLYVGQGAVEKLLAAWADLFSFLIVAVTVFAALSLGDQRGLAFSLAFVWDVRLWRGNPLMGFQSAFDKIVAIPVLLYELKEIHTRR